MNRHRGVSATLWNSAAFAGLPDDAQLLFFLVLSHPHMTALGAMRGTCDGLAAERGWNTSRARAAFDALCALDLVAGLDGCIALPDYFRHNPPALVGDLKAVEEAVDDVPEGPLRTRMIQAAVDACLATNHRPLIEAAQPLAALLDYEVKASDRPKRDSIPYRAIADAYNAALPTLQKARDVTAKRKQAIRRAWTGHKARRSLAFWTAYFDECAEDDFLNGTGPYGDGHKNWRPDLDYLLRESVIQRVYERALDRMEREA